MFIYLRASAVFEIHFRRERKNYLRQYKARQGHKPQLVVRVFLHGRDMNSSIGVSKDAC